MLVGWITNSKKIGLEAAKAWRGLSYRVGLARVNGGVPCGYRPIPDGLPSYAKTHCEPQMKCTSEDRIWYFLKMSPHIRRDDGQD